MIRMCPSRVCAWTIDPRLESLARLVALALLLIAARPASAQILPFAEYELDLENDNLIVRFSYLNTAGGVVIVPSGPNNFVTPGAVFQGQPLVFASGFQQRVTSVFWDLVDVADHEVVTWYINGNSAGFNSAMDFAFHYVAGTQIHVGAGAGALSGLYSHATPGDGFQISHGSAFTGAADVVIDADGKLVHAGGTLQANSLTINPGGQWLYLNGAADLGTGVTNHGSATFIDVTVNQEVHNAAGSTTDIVGDVTFTAPVSGPGAFFGSGTAHFDGGFSPGASPGVVPFEGGVEFGGDNLLEIELGGLAAGAFDRLEIAGDAILDGTLDVQLLDAFIPTAGDAFEILDVGGTLSGQFAGLAEGALIEFDTGVPLQLTYVGGDGNDVVLTAIPEPASLLLLLLAAPFAAARRRI